MSASGPKRPPAPYRRTMMDRHGSSFSDVLHAAGWSAMGAVMFPAAEILTGNGTRFGILTVPVTYVLGCAAIMTVAVLLGRPGAAVARFYLAPTGESTPYEEQFSQEDALVMQGDVAAALELFEQRIARQPGAIAVRIKAADLYAGLGRNPTRAAELLREVQRIPELDSGQDMYVGNRLADLYMGPLDTPARALVELRRLLERYPHSRVAPQLRQAIASLKPRIMGAGENG